MQNSVSGYHLRRTTSRTVSTVSPLQRGFKLEKVCFMKALSFLSKKRRKKKVLIYVHNADSSARRDFITDARFVLLKLLLCFLFFLPLLLLLPGLFVPDLFWSERDLFHALGAGEPSADRRLAIRPGKLQYSHYRNSQTCWLSAALASPSHREKKYMKKR